LKGRVSFAVGEAASFCLDSTAEPKAGSFGYDRVKKRPTKFGGTPQGVMGRLGETGQYRGKRLATQRRPELQSSDNLPRPARWPHVGAGMFLRA
jgi:hypothetical protein